MAATVPPPDSTVTFLFTDIEGSTRLWEEQHRAMREALAAHDALLCTVIERHGGHIFKTVGDAVYAAFSDAVDALNAAIEAQDALQQQLPQIHVRMALHTSPAETREGDYFGPGLSRVARLLAAGHGGQVLLSQAAATLNQPCLPAHVHLRALGVHRLRDIAASEAIFQLYHPGLPSEFPPLNTLDVAFRRGLRRAGAVAGVVLVVIGLFALAAVQNAHRARERELAARRERYVAQVTLAQQALESGNSRRARQLLLAQQPQPGEEDLRGFEWWYLWRQSQDESLRQWRVSTGVIWSVTFSPDGKTLAAASSPFMDRDRPGGVALFELRTGREWNIPLPKWSIDPSVAFSPDGRLLAIASHMETGIVQLWNVASRRLISTLKGAVGSVAFSPDGKLLATGSREGGFMIYNVAARAVIARPSKSSGLPVFSPDGKILASIAPSTTNHAVQLWDTRTWRELARLPGHRGWIHALAFSPDGRRLATGSRDLSVRVWDVAGRRLSATLPGHLDSVRGLAFSPDGKMLASTGADATLRLWDLRTREPIAVYRGAQKLYGVAFSPDGRAIAAGGHYATLRLWPTIPRREHDVLGASGHWARRLTFSPDGRLLATGGSQGDIKLWDVATQMGVALLRSKRADTGTVVFSPTGQFLVAGNSSGAVHIWDVAALRKIADLQDHQWGVWCAAFTPDGRYLATCGEDRTIKLWDMTTRKAAVTFRGHGGAVRTIAFSPDARLLASGGEDRTVRLWDMAAKQEKVSLKGHTEAILSLAFSPDGKILASSGLDHSIRLWDLRDNREIASLQGHLSEIPSVAFSPDGKTLASAGEDNVVRLWNVATRQEVVTLKGRENGIKAVGFSPDGRALAACMENGSVWLWRAMSATTP